jgi:hypothetical protein
MTRPIPQAVFALKAWTIKESGGKYYISPTAAFDDKTRWSKPYDSLQRACTAIGRKLATEWQERDMRRRDFHGIKGGAR